MLSEKAASATTGASSRHEVRIQSKDEDWLTVSSPWEIDHFTGIAAKAGSSNKCTADENRFQIVLTKYSLSINQLGDSKAKEELPRTHLLRRCSHWYYDVQPYMAIDLYGTERGSTPVRQTVMPRGVSCLVVPIDHPTLAFGSTKLRNHQRPHSSKPLDRRVKPVWG